MLQVEALSEDAWSSTNSDEETDGVGATAALLSSNTAQPANSDAATPKVVLQPSPETLERRHARRSQVVVLLDQLHELRATQVEARLFAVAIRDDVAAVARRMEKYLLRGIAAAAGATPTEAKAAAAALVGLPAASAGRPSTAEAEAAVLTDSSVTLKKASRKTKQPKKKPSTVKSARRDSRTSPDGRNSGGPKFHFSPMARTGSAATRQDESKRMKVHLKQLQDEVAVNERKARWWASRLQKEESARRAAQAMNQELEEQLSKLQLRIASKSNVSYFTAAHFVSGATRAEKKAKMRNSMERTVDPHD
eukprot:SAG31_NODE_7237_length_1747_cov_1.902306_1_plen_307_part_10